MTDFKNPYANNSVVATGALDTRKSLVRLHGPNNMKGKWVVPKSVVEGKSPVEIKRILGLQNEPTHVSKVNANGLNVRIGPTGYIHDFQGGGDAIQIEVLDNINLIKFFNTRPIGSVFK